MRIVIYCYQGMTMLDAIGPYEVLRGISKANVLFVSKKKGLITADGQALQLNIQHSIQEVKRADLLIVPGSTIGFIREIKDQRVLAWLRQINQSSQYTVSVCTGSIILAAAGLLAGKKATSHWKTLNFLSNYQAIPCKERWVQQGKFITAAGVSAGIDMGLYLAQQLKDDITAQAIQLAIEYDPQPIFDSGSPDKASAQVLQYAEKQLKRTAIKELRPWDWVKHAHTLLHNF